MDANENATKQDVQDLRQDLNEVRLELKQDMDRVIETMRDIETHLLTEFHRYSRGL
ncbi:MAG: hypothetical protein IT168_14445 [Bryobacterales bacterium]|nr:hypothetical protein [Bryobacterales bacterium]